MDLDCRMNLDKYPVFENAEGLAFEFYSEGPKGSIKKVIEYQEFSKNIFNLMFGDWDEKSKKIINHSRSNNGDRDKILATVASTVIDFMRTRSKAVIFAKGETPEKTRLYQMAINKNWEIISRLFIIKGFYLGVWEPFKKGKNYDACMLEV